MVSSEGAIRRDSGRATETIRWHNPVESSKNPCFGREIPCWQPIRGIDITSVLCRCVRPLTAHPWTVPPTGCALIKFVYESCRPALAQEWLRLPTSLLKRSTYSYGSKAQTRPRLAQIARIWGEFTGELGEPLYAGPIVAELSRRWGESEIQAAVYFAHFHNNFRYII